MSTSTDILFRPIYYSQTDSRWANLDYSAPGESTTIGKAGCGPTCAAMIASEWYATTTPDATARWALQHGYKAKNQGTYYSFFKAYFKELGMTCTQLNGSDLRSTGSTNQNNYLTRLSEELQQGNMAILCLGKSKWTSSGHFVVAYRRVFNTIYLNDPNKDKNNSSYQFAHIDELKDCLKYIWIIEQPATYKPTNGTRYEVNSAEGASNIRCCPNTVSDIMTTFTNKYKIDTYEVEGGWHRVNIAGLRGYIHNSQLVSIAPWWQQAVDDLRSKGIINGDEEGNYDGEKPATKGVVAQMIYNLLQYLKGV